MLVYICAHILILFLFTGLIQVYAYFSSLHLVCVFSVGYAHGHNNNRICIHMLNRHRPTSNRTEVPTIVIT